MRRYWWIYLLVTVFVAIWGIRALTDDPVVTQTTRSIEYENKLTATGLLVRNEVVYTTPNPGMSEAVFQNEERVSKGAKIATVYLDGIDPQIKQELDAVNAKIRRMEKKSATNIGNTADVASTEERINKTVSNIVDMSLNGNFEELDIFAAELVAYTSIREGETVDNPVQETLESLYGQKQSLEKSVQSAKRDIYSDMAGVFVAETDGYESILTPESVEKMSAVDFEAINIEHEAFMPESLNAGDRVCKIVDNTQWYVAVLVDASYLEQFAPGKRVWIRLTDKSTERYEATVWSVSAQTDGKAVLAVACDYYVEGVYSMRKVNVEIISRLYEGFELVPAAIRVDEDGQTGVFVNVSGIVHFRKIDILYKDENLVIAAKSDENGYLKLYDEVIVNGKNIYNGAILK